MNISQPKTGGSSAGSVIIELKCNKCQLPGETLYPIDIGDNETENVVMMCSSCIEKYDIEVEKERNRAQVRLTLKHLRESSEIPKRFADATFESFHLPGEPNDALFSPKESVLVKFVYDSVLKFMEAVISGDTQIAVFTGSVGTGKTHLAIACIRRMVGAGMPSKFYHARALINALMSNEAYEAIMGDILSNKLVVIDDITTASISDFTRRSLSDIIDRCYSGGVSMILTFQESDMKKIIEDYIDRRGVDRTQDSPSGGIIKFKWRSVRGRLETERSCERRIDI